MDLCFSDTMLIDRAVEEMVRSQDAGSESVYAKDFDSDAYECETAGRPGDRDWWSFMLIDPLRR